MTDFDDAEDIEAISDNDDLIKVGSRLFQNIPYKKAGLLGIVLLLVLSTNFIRLMEVIPDTVAMGSPTTKGSVIQIVVILLAYIVIDLLVSSGMV